MFLFFQQFEAQNVLITRPGGSRDEISTPFFFFFGGGGGGGGEGKGSRADTHASRHARNRDERVANLDPQDTD